MCTCTQELHAHTTGMKAADGVTAKRKAAKDKVEAAGSRCSSRRHSPSALLQRPNRSALESSSPSEKVVKVGKGDKVDQQSTCAYQQHCLASYRSFIQRLSNVDGVLCSIP